MAGRVRRVIYRSGDGFTVLELVRDGTGQRTATLVGHLPVLAPGERLTATGRWIEHPRYGPRFAVVTFTLADLKAGDELVEFLASGLIEGVGPELARRIVAALGPDALAAIETDPAVLLQVSGIGPARAERIHRALVERRELLTTIAELGRRSVPASIAGRLYAHWGGEATARFDADPYGALLALPGMSFAQVDAIILAAGGDPGDATRLQLGLEAVLHRAVAEQGHVYLPQAELLQRAVRQLWAGVVGSDGSEAMGACAEALAALAASGRIVREGGRVYLPELHEAELIAAGHLRRMLGSRAAFTTLDAEGSSAGGPTADPLARLGPIADELDPLQRTAVRMALSHSLTIVTGGPGTGKSTTARALIACVERLDASSRVLLAAPTGRAARRLAELTGRPAATIHRLLEVTADAAGAPDRSLFRRDEDHPLDGELLIVDEASMLDLPLAAALFRAVPDGMRVVLIGDVDQLPPIGPGNVLQDLITAGVACVRLERVYRQGEASRILDAAHQVRQGSLPEDIISSAVEADPTQAGKDWASGGELLWYPCANGQRAAELVVALTAAALASGLSAAEVQVLSPLRRGPAGVTALNRLLQARLNPDAPGLRRGERDFRVGDKVMCTRNDYGKGADGIFNGQVGFITRVEADIARIWVDFDGEVVEYTDDELADLELAYCMTVHKAQGSEFDTVILCLLDEHRPLLRRNLLYTAITRARHRLLLVASLEALRRAAAHSGGERRYSALADRTSRR
ncbi:MAG TPA: ATP-dependent RecD-like DNA helicase [Bacillota bacterium]